MLPLEFMQRLAALVPRPRRHLIRFHGVLAPNAELRAQVVPQVAAAPAQGAPPADCEANCAHHCPVRLRWVKLLKRVFEIDMEHCPNCGGQLKINAATPEQPVIEKTLTHLGLQADCGHRSAPARGPVPQDGLALASASAACKGCCRHDNARRPGCGSPQRTTPTHLQPASPEARPERRPVTEAPCAVAVIVHRTHLKTIRHR